MKTSLLFVLCLGMISSAFSAERDYACIAQKLQAINSDIYYDLSDAEIYSMITIPEMVGHIDAIYAERACEAEAAQ